MFAMAEDARTVFEEAEATVFDAVVASVLIRLGLWRRMRLWRLKQNHVL